MDPQSQSFTPHNHTASSDSWRLQTDVARIQQIQAEHADRILRLERRQEDDARMKSVWGNQSPFPSVLSGGTPQQAPVQNPPGDQFRTFDDETANMMSSLHLDAEEEPRRGLSANSRANSVRFDESANQNHFSHSSRPSADFMSRTSSGLGGLQMTERTSSHKSEGRASSVHSIRSLASGRANSLNLDSTILGFGDLNRGPLETPGIAPGLMLLGPAPAIIRCWMNTNFKHDALLYAAVCTGSFKSFLDLRLIQKLGFESVIRTNRDGVRVVDLPMFFPEAVPHPASSRSSSPAPSLPSLLVEFRVIESVGQDESKAIQIFLGSDVLRAHNADIMFSSNRMTIYDNEGSKLSIPLARPENEAAFNSLFVTSGAMPFSKTRATQDSEASADEGATEQPYLNGLGQGTSTASVSSTTTSPPPGKHRTSGASVAEGQLSAIGSDRTSRPALSVLDTKPEREDIQVQDDARSQTTPLRAESTLAGRGSWRRESTTPASATQPTGLDWANISKSREVSYQRKETGIKVLKPKTASRAFSSTAVTPTTTTTTTTGISSPADAKSRFFDEGRRRSVGENTSGKVAVKPNGTTASVLSPTSASASATATATQKTKANPIGGASAFSWLNSGGGPK